jgi:hypothetical protein
MKTSLDLNAASGLKRHTYLKHIALLCEAGLLIQKENQQDRRKPLYALPPSAVTIRTNDSLTVDFGCCLLRRES